MAQASQSEWECAICREEFSDELAARKPRLLSCAHSFCSECLEKQPKHSSSSSSSSSGNPVEKVIM
jgi:hypothetical protein